MMRVSKGKQSYQLLLEYLQDGGIVIMACDTIYGFVGVVPGSEEGIRKVKGREETKPFLQLIDDVSSLSGLGYPEPPHGFAALWPGPFTYVLKASDKSTTAFRVPEDDRLRQLVRDIGYPLYSTSVNRAGQAPMDNPEKIFHEFGTEVGIIEDAGLFTGREPSTVVNLTVRPYTILRQGAGIVPAHILS